MRERAHVLCPPLLLVRCPKLTQSCFRNDTTESPQMAGSPDLVVAGLPEVVTLSSDEEITLSSDDEAAVKVVSYCTRKPPPNPGWLCPGLEVLVADSHAAPTLRGRRGLVKGVVAGKAVITLRDGGETIVIPAGYLVPSPPRCGDRVKVIRGIRERGETGRLIAYLGQERPRTEGQEGGPIRQDRVRMDQDGVARLIPHLALCKLV